MAFFYVHNFETSPSIFPWSLAKSVYAGSSADGISQNSRESNDITYDKRSKMKNMAIGVVEFSREGYKIRKVFA